MQIVMTSEIKKHIGQVIDCLIANDARKATKFISPKLVITATRKIFGGEIDKRANIEVVIKIGKPNFAERDFIKQCKKAGEPFPVKKIQIKTIKRK